MDESPKTTPKAAKILAGALSMHQWEQLDLARESTIHRTTVSHHIAGLRAIRDDHLALYVTCLDKTEQAMLVAAWLQDTLPEAAAENILDSVTGLVREEVRSFTIGLSLEQTSMLKFWANKLREDPELDFIFTDISRKAGWIP